MKQEDLSNILKNIELTGGVTNEPGKVIYVNKGLDNIIDRSNGKPRISPAKVLQFNLILSQPNELNSLSPFEIRCLGCNKVISYPSWLLEVKFDKSTFFYFVCFSQISPLRVKLGICPINR